MMRVFTVVGTAGVLLHARRYRCPQLSQQFQQAAAVRVRAGQAHHRDVRGELADVARHVGRAAGIIRFAR